MSAELAYLSAREVAARIRRGELRSRDHLEALLERVARLDGGLNAVVTLDAERARREADAADRALRDGAARGALHGVCMTIKDSFMTRGMRTTSGAVELRDLVPETDAVPVARLRSAGAVIFGKTNLPRYADDVQSFNDVFGRTNNPWNPARTCGGSSGGAAAALAAGFTPLELGSDIGGSIRNPASHCGVCGHKPSYGIVSARGQIPGPPGTLTQADIAVAGPMARDVDDLELGLAALAAPDDWHDVAWRLELPSARHRELRDFRVAVWMDEAGAPIDSAVRACLERAVEALERAGARVDRKARPEFAFDYAVEVYEALLQAAESGGFSRGEIEQMAAREPAGPGDVGARLARLAALRHREWLSQNERRLQLRRKWRDFFRAWDAVLLPVEPTTAIAHDPSQPAWARTIQVSGTPRPYTDQFKWVGLIGVAYLPATVVPIGTTPEGLPVGIQVAGPFLEDRTALALARHLERLLGGFRRPPGY